MAGSAGDVVVLIEPEEFFVFERSGFPAVGSVALSAGDRPLGVHLIAGCDMA